MLRPQRSPEKDKDEQKGEWLNTWGNEFKHMSGIIWIELFVQLIAAAWVVL
jgi:hypothetical protein